MTIKNEDTLNVFVGEIHAGTLTRSEGKFTFQYITLDTPPLSITLPVRSEPYPDMIARGYFANLLPEGKARDYITRQLKLPPEDDFALLYAIGRECAGAVSLVPPTETPAQVYEYEDLGEDRLYALVKNLPLFPSAVGDKKVKLSLAGAQSKLAVFRDGAGYKIPLNGAPTTHIIKKSMDPDLFPDSVQNEAFVMKLAGRTGLNVPKAEMSAVRGMPFYVIERYDRRVQATGILRLVQEDFCQATKTPPTCKYQEQGGPDVTECYDIIVKYSVDVRADIEQFLKLIAFNILIGNHDAHEIGRAHV